MPRETVCDCMKLADLATSANIDCFSFGTIRLAADDSALLLAKLTCAEANLPPHDCELDTFYFVVVATPIVVGVFFVLPAVMVSIARDDMGLLLL